MSAEGDKAATTLTIISGFLGAGKTSFIDRVLKAYPNKAIGVIVNEFSASSVDHLLLSDGVETVPISGGCVCCGTRNLLIEKIEQMLFSNRSPRIGSSGDECAGQRTLDHLIIEASGLAEVGPLLDAIVGSQRLNNTIGSYSIVTLVSAQEWQDQIDLPEFSHQVGMADRLILTKTDGVPAYLRDQTVAQLCARLSLINPEAQIFDLSQLVGEGEENGIDRVLMGDRFAKVPTLHERARPTINQHHHDHASYGCEVLSLDRSVGLEAIKAFVEQLQIRLGDGLLRVKGFVGHDERPDVPWLVQVVGAQMPRFTQRHVGEKFHRTELVVIYKISGQQPLEPWFKSFFGEPMVDQPDRQAIDHNPLSIPGL